MATVIGQAEEHPPHHDLHRLVLGHAGILALIAEHAAERERELEIRREAHSGHELDRGAAGPGTV